MKYVKVTDGVVTISFRCHEPISNLLNEHLECESPGQFKTSQITISNQGVEFETNPVDLEKWAILYADGRWSQFVKEHTKGDFTLTGIEAALLWMHYSAWAKDIEAEQAINELESGKITFQELNALAPYLQDHSAIQAYATKALFQNTIPRKNGKPRTGTDQPDSVRELIAWVKFYRGMNALTIEKAVAYALGNHPGLIPEGWTEPEDALAKAYGRHEKSRTNLKDTN